MGWTFPANCVLFSTDNIPKLYENDFDPFNEFAGNTFAYIGHAQNSERKFFSSDCHASVFDSRDFRFLFCENFERILPFPVFIQNVLRSGVYFGFRHIIFQIPSHGRNRKVSVLPDLLIFFLFRSIHIYSRTIHFGCPMHIHSFDGNNP